MRFKDFWQTLDLKIGTRDSSWDENDFIVWNLLEFALFFIAC